VKNEGFSRVRERSEPDDSLDQVIGVVPQQVTSYTEILIDTMPYLRNNLAHGNPMLHPNGASSEDYVRNSSTNSFRGEAANYRSVCQTEGQQGEWDDPIRRTGG
jgi:hypothetical protein